jgi:hypothetical protein
MGEIAEGLINGDFDYITGEYIGRGMGFPRTATDRNRHDKKSAYKRMSPSERKIASIRKEIAILVNEGGVPLNDARKAMNEKYGKGWRERGLSPGSEEQWSEEDLQPFL